MNCTLQLGDIMTLGSVYRIDPDGVHVNRSIESLLRGNRAVIFGGPAPFSRLDTEQAKQYADLSKQILKHVNVIYGIYCQDAFVMKKFDEHVSQEHPDHGVTFYGDGDAFFIRNYNLQYDFTNQGLSVRSGRYAFIVNDTKIEHIVLDDYTQIGDSGADKILAWLESNKR